jgi:hypothetical protein
VTTLATKREHERQAERREGEWTERDGKTNQMREEQHRKAALYDGSGTNEQVGERKGHRGTRSFIERRSGRIGSESGTE